MTSTSSIRHTLPFSSRRRAFVGCAAALGTLSSSSSSCWAFVAPHSALHHPAAATFPSSALLVNGSPSSKKSAHNNNIFTHQQHQQLQSTRLFFSSSRNNNNEDDDWQTLKKAGGNILKKAADKVKSILPFGKTEEEKAAQLAKKQRKEDIKGGINSMLQDMPLPVRLMGRMVAPMLSKAAEQIAEQSQQAADMVEDARFRIMNDPAVVSKLGSPIQVGQPFSQSSSTMVINGKSSARVNASFQVAGPYGSGVATLESTDGQIVNLVVNVNGMNIKVGSMYGSASGYSSSSSSSSNSKKGDIIEAEIIEKK
jgi:hypothetical protein